MSKKKKISLKELAASLGVSPTLVSIVLNGKAKQYRISDEMAKKVKAAAQEMHYTPNVAARNLRSGKSNLIGVIVTDISNPFYSTLSRIIEDKANEFNYNVLFSSSDEDIESTKNLVEVLLNKGVDGLILVPCDGSKNLVKTISEDKFPLVLLDRHFPDLNVSYSCLDNYKSTELITQHLIKQGYKKISIVAYVTEMVHINHRIAGYQDEMIKAGLEDKIVIERINISNANNEIGETLENLVSKHKTEAVIFTTNMLAVSGIYYLNEKGVKIPDELAVVGFNRNDVFNLYYSPISYIKQPLEIIANEAVNMLIQQIETPDQPNKLMVVAEPELVIQQSSIKV
jgi:LacI family transcriptional regulator